MLPHQKGKELNKTDMLGILHELDDNLEGIQRKVKLYGLGGTFLVISGIRYVSKDVDFIVSREDFRTLSGPVAEIEWKKRVRFDLFPDGLLPDYKYSSYANNAKRFSRSFKNIELYFLDTVDLVLTKVLAGRDSDYQDLGQMEISIKNVPREELLRRFEQVQPAPEKKDELTAKFERFVSEFYKK
ncbi:hypothetical protein KY346_01215 [Candidatus Woesearchaeota archaeon]|nr:hypothetical protein [Candidatus Woesearchaeota archaeon]